MNRVILTGRLGQDPEVRYVSPDVPVANFTMATSESYKNKDGERVENTQWHKCVVWRHLATLAEKYLNKGSHIAVEGKIEYKTYEGQDGVKKYFTEIVISNIEFLGKNENSGSEQESSAPQQQYSAPAPQNDYSDSGDDEVDGLPF